METWDIYDKDRRLTGKTMRRGEAFAPGAYHLVVHVCLFNSRGQMLIQQRQPFKEGWPNRWDITVGGSAKVGETSAAAAEREVYEEIGYSLNLNGARPILSINFENGFDDFFFANSEVTVDRLKLQREEVQRVKWVHKAEIMAMIASGLFIPYHRSFIDLLFDMNQYAGIHTGPMD
ncbi:MAG: NUDIX domain-containing protein [Sporolactobacillus sp.]